MRADYRCVSSSEGQRYVWEQDVDGTPFERIVREASWALELHPVEGGTEVVLHSERRLRGLSRLGSPMMRRAARRDLNEALDGLERALAP